jgi:hypothetical protein
MYDIFGTVWGIQLEMAILLSNNATMANPGSLLKPDKIYDSFKYKPYIRAVKDILVCPRLEFKSTSPPLLSRIFPRSNQG